MDTRYLVHTVFEDANGKRREGESEVAVGWAAMRAAVKAADERHAADLTYLGAHHSLCAGSVRSQSCTPPSPKRPGSSIWDRCVRVKMFELAWD